ncbi:hypothetical protein PsYK624_108320 [Phanerochaete sordida]|uniref:Uncharacterized protein n=1 Tax=Phanerochaete sordida TaxID=48140 RepID=A0A9P3LGK9_9APHY|nr:hypothetical protein PsYK624_108320 [Phanerochaete sordida]
MRLTFLSILAFLCGLQMVSAVCCYYGSVGGCRRAVENPLLRRQSEDIRSESPGIHAREVCCCTAGTTDLCETHCG